MTLSLGTFLANTAQRCSSDGPRSCCAALHKVFAFLQSVVALFTLVVSIIVHMACWPYEEMFLNIAELCSLVCLFTLVGLALLLWYVQAPGRTKYVVLYESAVTFIIFSQYAVLFAVLLGRVVYLELREKSNNIIQKCPE